MIIGKKISQYKLDPTLNWHIAEIVIVNDDNLKFKLIGEQNTITEGILLHKNIKWSVPKNKSIKDVHKAGDLIFIKK